MTEQPGHKNPADDQALSSIEKTARRLEERFHYWEEVNRMQSATVLDRLRTLNQTLAICAMLLAYIAYRLS